MMRDYAGKTDFQSEYLHLRNTPTNSSEAYNKLACLSELDKRRNPNHKPYSYGVFHRSKRYARLVRMYWAFLHREKKTMTDTWKECSDGY